MEATDPVTTLTPEQIQAIQEIEATICERGSQSLSQALNSEVRLHSPLVVAGKTLDCLSEFSANVVVLQFQFDDGTPQFAVISTDLASALASLGAEAPIEVDPENLEPIKPKVQAVVTALADGVASALGTPIVPSGFQVSVGALEFPENFSDTAELLRIQIAVSGDVNGSLTWLIHPFTISQLFPNTAVAPQEHPETKQAKADLEVLLDVPLTISVELGRVTMKVQEVIDLGAGSIIEIDKAAGEPIDILVNGKLVARGEVVVVDDNFGVRVTEILSPKDRVLTLGDVA
jgi:flagellar motor switch protein FliN/FliY